MKALKNSLFRRGFDVFHLFDISRYNAAVPLHALPTFSRAKPLGTLVGNSRHFWPVFVSALRKDPGLAERKNPLDEYVNENITAACKEASEFKWKCELRWSHDVSAGRVACPRCFSLSLSVLQVAWLPCRSSLTSLAWLRWIRAVFSTFTLCSGLGSRFVR